MKKRESKRNSVCVHVFTCVYRMSHLGDIHTIEQVVASVSVGMSLLFGCHQDMFLVQCYLTNK